LPIIFKVLMSSIH